MERKMVPIHISNTSNEATCLKFIFTIVLDACYTSFRFSNAILISKCSV